MFPELELLIYWIAERERVRKRREAGEPRSSPPLPETSTSIAAATSPAAPHAIPELTAARDPDAPHLLFQDCETRSAADLKSTGAWKYAADPTTEILCLAYAVDDEPVQLWTPGDPVPPEFIEAANNPNWLVVAHNDNFERLISRHILEPRHGFPAIPIERRRCSMAVALASALPAALDKAVAALGLPYAKDKVGQALMRRMSRPLPGGGWIEDPASLNRLSIYSAKDVEAERALYQALPPLTVDEQKLWELDARINERGFAVDVELLDAAQKVVTKVETTLQAEFCKLTGLDKGTNQVEKFIAWLAAHGCVVSDVRKGTLRQALQRKGLEPAVRRAIEIRLQLAHASAVKVRALLAWRGNDNRVRGAFRFHGAGTGRWTSHGVQVQNFKRDGQAIDAKIAAIMNGVVGVDSPVEAVGDIARALIVAAPGHRLFIADFSGIESRVLAWISEQQTKLEQWARFDASGTLEDDPYFILGRNCGQPEQIARAIGKIADLAFGYMGGTGAWDRLAPEDDGSTEDDKRRYQRKWRELHPRTVRFWLGIDRAAIAAVRQPGATFSYKRLLAAYDGKFLRLTLPAGRALSYPFPRFEAGKYGDPMVVFKDNAAGKFVDCRFGQGAYGGLWTENIVQAVARDLLAAAMLRLEAAGYKTVLHIHDELVAEVPDDFGSVDEFQRIITALPDWAAGLPIAARVREAARFSKPDPAGIGATAESHGAGIEPEPDEVTAGGDDGPLAEILDADNEPAPAAAAASRGFSADLPGNVAAGLDELRERARNSSTNSTGTAPPASDAAAAILGAADDGASDDSEQADHHADDGARATNGSGAGDTTAGNGDAGAGANFKSDAGFNRDAESGNGHDRNRDGYPHGERRTGHHVATYLYRDHLGGNHTRIERWRRPGAKRAQYPQAFWVDGRWVSQKPEGWLKVPYRLPEMLAAIAASRNVDVYVPEGEKDADTIAALGLIATTSSEGATPLKAKISNWTPELNKWFDGVKRLFILEDNDEAGRKFAREKARALENIVPDIRIVTFPDVPETEDVSWWLAHGHSKEELLARCEAAPRWQTDELESVRASSIEMEAFDWLWFERFALGKIGIIAGLPDEGKGQVLAYIASRCTNPNLEWPNAEGRAPQGNVILLTAEDDPADTVVPRFVAAGADLGRIEIVKMIHDRDEKTGQPRRRMFSLVSDLDKLRKKIAEVGNVVAVEIDPISAYLGVGKIDSFRDSDVRSVLGPLKELAGEMRVAMFAVMHFNKKADVINAMLRISNSIAFSAASRHAYGIVEDAEQGRTLMVRAKNNLVSKADSKNLAFHFDERLVGTDRRNGKPIKAPFIVFNPGYVDVTATEALQAAAENKSLGQRDKAKQFLLAILAGEPVPVKEIEEAAAAELISKRTLERAKEALHIIVDKDRATPSGKWFWKLPGDGAPA